MKIFEVTSTPKYMYHVSKQSNRDSIGKQGLLPLNKEDLNIIRKPGVYLFSDVNDAKEWAHWGKITYREPHDIWQVSIPLQYKLTKDKHPEMKSFSSYIGYDSIPPDRIKALSTDF